MGTTVNPIFTTNGSRSRTAIVASIVILAASCSIRTCVLVWASNAFNNLNGILDWCLYVLYSILQIKIGHLKLNIIEDFQIKTMVRQFLTIKTHIQGMKNQLTLSKENLIDWFGKARPNLEFTASNTKIGNKICRNTILSYVGPIPVFILIRNLSRWEAGHSNVLGILSQIPVWIIKSFIIKQERN